MAARSARDMADMAVESAYVEPAAAHLKLLRDDRLSGVVWHQHVAAADVNVII